jgi:ABC-type sugar transport system permease subunit
MPEVFIWVVLTLIAVFGIGVGIAALWNHDSEERGER